MKIVEENKKLKENIIRMQEEVEICKKYIRNEASELEPYQLKSLMIRDETNEIIKAKVGYYFMD